MKQLFVCFSFAQESGIKLVFIKMTQPHVNIIYLITMASNAYKIFQKFVSEINEQILRLRRYGSNLIKTKENSYRRGFHAPTLPLHISENCDTK